RPARSILTSAAPPPCSGRHRPVAAVAAAANRAAPPPPRRRAEPCVCAMPPCGFARPGRAVPATVWHGPVLPAGRSLGAPPRAMLHRKISSSLKLTIELTVAQQSAWLLRLVALAALRVPNMRRRHNRRLHVGSGSSGDSPMNKVALVTGITGQ